MPPPDLVPAPFHILVETGIHIVLRLAHVAVLDRIVVNVMKVVCQILFIANDVIPKSVLSQVGLARDPVRLLVVQRKVSLK